MENYIDTNAGDFLAENAGFLDLTGAAANKTSSFDDDFYKVYSNLKF